MSENQFKPEPGTQQNYQPSQDTRREYENPTGDNSAIIDDNERAAPQEFPERSHQHDYKNPSGNQIDNDVDDDDVDTDGEIFDQDEDEATDPVDEQSLDSDDPDQSEMRR